VQPRTATAPASRLQTARATATVWAALAFSVLLAGCGSAPTRAPTVAAPTTTTPADAIPAQLTLEQANEVTLYAITLVGTPYHWGGNTPDSGFDCSGLIAHVYRTHAGLQTPRTVQDLSNWGTSVPPQSRRSGDLVLFAPHGGGVTHAGIYVGDGRFVHAPSTGGKVRLEHLDSPYWQRQQPSYRRP